VTYITPGFRDSVKALADRATEPIADLTTRLTEVAAPTGDEGDRAAVLADVMRRAGFEDVVVDALHDVTGRIRGKRSDRCVLLAAHIDTVFPRTVDVHVKRKGDRLLAPGVGDNTLSVASVVQLKALLEQLGVVPEVDILVTGNVGEEGLGDLRGMRAVMDAHDDIGAAIAVEGHALGRVTHQGVGSRRLEVRITGPGGHSWGDFGRPSAIHAAGRLVAELDAIDLPNEPKTTLNVGILAGGISVNTIAPEARLVIDMRSLEQQALENLVREAERTIAAVGTDELSVAITVVGDRPAGRLPADRGLVPIARNALSLLDIEAVLDASSTDANIPISRNIPAICIGIASGGNAHREDEYIDLALVPTGMTQLAMVTLEAARLLADKDLTIA
jgi:acetylornithine deacetylase/succinyl-diaminopimelate desuccinylase-like protein